MIGEIKKIKVALTSDCTLRCNHCRIDKNSGLNIGFRQAKKAVDLLLSSKGAYKRLELYGGEPFLRFNLLKKISRYALGKSKRSNKKISISVATNATALDPEKISWIKRNKINISVSFSGTRESHDYNRIFERGKGSYNLVRKNIKSLMEAVPPEYLVCLYCVDGAFAKNIKKDFKAIVEAGFKIVNIECVSGRGWNRKNYQEFKEGLSFVFGYIMKNAESGGFICLEPFMEMLKDRRAWDFNCPKYRDLEMYPDGNYGFYPYAFMDYKKNKEAVSIGNFQDGLDEKYLNCSPFSPRCENCISEYYRLPGLADGSAAYEYRSREMKKFFFDFLKDRSQKKTMEYIVNLDKIFRLTYV